MYVASILMHANMYRTCCIVFIAYFLCTYRAITYPYVQFCDVALLLGGYFGAALTVNLYGKQTKLKRLEWAKRYLQESKKKECLLILYGVMNVVYNLKCIASIVAAKWENHQETSPGNLLHTCTM